MLVCAVVAVAMHSFPRDCIVIPNAQHASLLADVCGMASCGYMYVRLASGLAQRELHVVGLLQQQHEEEESPV
jgi:hypothetical protein